MDRNVIPQIILLTHGNWGEELIKSAEMIIGSISNIKTFPLFTETPLKEYVVSIKRELDSNTGYAIVLTDIFGGTTSNAAAMLSRYHNIVAISGLNMEMLITANSVRRKYKCEDTKVIGDAIKGGGCDGCINIIETLMNINERRRGD